MDQFSKEPWTKEEAMEEAGVLFTAATEFIRAGKCVPITCSLLFRKPGSKERTVAVIPDLSELPSKDAIAEVTKLAARHVGAEYTIFLSEVWHAAVAKKDAAAYASLRMQGVEVRDLPNVEDQLIIVVQGKGGFSAVISAKVTGPEGAPREVGPRQITNHTVAGRFGDLAGRADEN